MQGKHFTADAGIHRVIPPDVAGKGEHLHAGFACGVRPDRHGWLDELCGPLETQIRAAAAADLQAHPAGWPVRGAVKTLPSRRVAKPVADVGRKARAADSGTQLQPVRFGWEPAPRIQHHMPLVRLQL